MRACPFSSSVGAKLPGALVSLINTIERDLKARGGQPHRALRRRTCRHRGIARPIGRRRVRPGAQTTARGFPGEPVAPLIGSGAKM